MAGCFGDSAEDRFFERQMLKHVDSCFDTTPEYAYPPEEEIELYGLDSSFDHGYAYTIDRNGKTYRFGYFVDERFYDPDLKQYFERWELA